MNTHLEKIDHSAIKTSQAFVISINILAFILDQPWLAVFITLTMILGTIRKTAGFGFFYSLVLKPLGWVKPDIRLDNHEPHRFAQGLGSIFMATGSLVLLAGASSIGWIFIWLVTGLAALNLFAGFCVGCMFYYWLSRINAPGFHKTPPEGTLPGMRPNTKVIQ